MIGAVVLLLLRVGDARPGRPRGGRCWHPVRWRRCYSTRQPAEALVYLSLDGDDARVGLVADGAVDALCAAVSGGGAGAAHAATALTSLATVGVNKCTIEAYPSAIPALARLLRRGGTRECRAAATTLYELCKLPENPHRTMRASAVPALVELVAAGSARTVKVLGLLAENREGRHDLSRIADIISVLCSVVGSGNARVIDQFLLVMMHVAPPKSHQSRLPIGQDAGQTSGARGELRQLTVDP